MNRHIALVALLALGCPLLAADPPADQAKLQGVWLSPADAPKAVRLIILDDKVGYSVGDTAANPPVPGSSFVGASEAKYGEAAGKRYADIQIAKDYTRRVEYRFEKDRLVVGIGGTEYPLQRVTTRADDAAAKKFAGTWTVTGAEVKGVKSGAKDAGIESVVIAGDRYTWKAAGGKEILNAHFRLVEAKDGRAELDVYGMKGQVVVPAIVEVSGDELTIAQPLKPATGTRPAGFDTKGGDDLVIRATRAK